jgi:hypothetical protein
VCVLGLEVQELEDVLAVLEGAAGHHVDRAVVEELRATGLDLPVRALDLGHALVSQIREKKEGQVRSRKGRRVAKGEGGEKSRREESGGAGPDLVFACEDLELALLQGEVLSDHGPVKWSKGKGSTVYH